MEFAIRKSEIGFKYFLQHQIHAVKFVAENDKTYPIDKEERLKTYASSLHILDLYDAFLLHLDEGEKAVIKYLSDSTPITYRKIPKDYGSLYPKVYEKWIDIFFKNNVNQLPYVDYKVLGRTMKLWRKDNRVKLTHLSEILEIDSSLLSRIEKGERRPTLELIINFCYLTNLHINDLLSESLKRDIHIR